MIQAVIVCTFHFFATLQKKNWLGDCPPHLCDAITNRQSLHSISLMLVTSFNANHHLSLNSNESVLSLILTKPSSRSTSWARFIFQSYWSWGGGTEHTSMWCLRGHSQTTSLSINLEILEFGINLASNGEGADHNECNPPHLTLFLKTWKMHRKVGGEAENAKKRKNNWKMQQQNKRNSNADTFFIHIS